MLPEFAPKHLYKTVFLKFLKTRHTLFLSFAFHFHTFLNNLSRKTILWTLDIYLHCIFLFLLKALCKGCLLILQTDPTRILDFWIFPRHYMSSYNQSIQTMVQALKQNVYVDVNFLCSHKINILGITSLFFSYRDIDFYCIFLFQYHRQGKIILRFLYSEGLFSKHIFWFYHETRLHT